MTPRQPGLNRDSDPKAPDPAQASLVFRLLAPLCLISFVLVTAFSASLLLNQRLNSKRMADHVTNDAIQSLDLSLKRRAKVLAALQDTILADSQLAATLAKQDREQLLLLYQPLFQHLRDQYRLTHFYFHLPDRVNLLRVHKPSKHGDLINRHTAMQAAQTGKRSSGIELGPLGTFTLRVVQPVLYQGTLVGYLELGQEIEAILNLIHTRLGVHLAIAIDKKQLNRQQWQVGMAMLGRSSNWQRFPRQALCYSSMDPLPTACNEFINSNQTTSHLTLQDQHWQLSCHPLTDVSGKRVGKLLMLYDTTQAKTSFRRLLFSATSLSLLLLTALICLYFVLLRRTDRLIQQQQSQLAASEERQRSLLDAIDRTGLFLFVVDENYQVRYMNQAMKESFGDQQGKTCETSHDCSHPCFRLVKPVELFVQEEILKWMLRVELLADCLHVPHCFGCALGTNP